MSANHQLESPATATTRQETLPLHLFVYGTLKLGEPNEHILLGAGGGGGVMYAGLARTQERYPLVIGSRANIPFLLNRPGQGRQILGHVACVRTRKALAELDKFEGCPELYSRQPVAVELLGQLLPGNHGGHGHDTDCPLALGQTGATAVCQMYVYSGPDERLVGLPHLDDYRSSGDHGLPYLSSQDDIQSPDQVGEAAE